MAKNIKLTNGSTLTLANDYNSSKMFAFYSEGTNLTLRDESKIVFDNCEISDSHYGGWDKAVDEFAKYDFVPGAGETKKSITTNGAKYTGILQCKTAKVALTANNRVFDASPEDLVTQGAFSNGAVSVQYALDVIPAEPAFWSTEIPQGADARKYTVYYLVTSDKEYINPDQGQIEVTISAKPLNATVTVANKEYDGTTNATITSVTVDTGIAGESLTISGLTATFADANAGTGKTVNINSTAAVVTAVNSDTKVSNYKVSYPATVTADITKKTIVSPNDPSDPNYGAITLSVPTEGYTYDGTEKKPTVTVKDGETKLTLDKDYTVGYTNNIDAGDNTATVTITGTGSYTINATRTFSIAKKPLNANVKAEDKPYDGNTTATVSATVSTGITGQTLKITGLTGTFDDAEVGTDKTVTINSSAAVVTANETGTKPSNYSITYPATVKASITSAGKTIVSPNDPSDPNYGAITLSVPTEGYTYDGKAKTPTVTVKDGETKLTLDKDYTVSYTNNIDAGDNTAIVTITGAGIYTINETRTFSIKQAPLTITAQNKEREVGEENPTLTVSYSGFMNGENESVLTTKPTVTTTATTASPEGTYPIKASGAAAKNYTISYVDGTLTVHATGSTITLPGGSSGCGIRVVRNDTGVEVDNTATLVYTSGNKALRIAHVTIVAPADASASNPVGVTVYIPASLKDNTNKVLPTSGVGSDIIVTDANVPVTDIWMPDTKAMLDIADNGFRLASGKSAFIHTPLWLLDDYALCSGLRKEYADSHVLTTLSPVNYYWTFACGVDVYVPKDVLVYSCKNYTNEELQINLLVEELLDKGNTIIKHNNGVILECSTLGKSYDMIAYPGRVPTGTAITKTDAHDYEGNLLEPVIDDTNYKPEYCYVLKDNTFHTILNNDSKVTACHAIVRKPSSSSARILRIVGGQHTTAIESIESDAVETTDRWYDLQGRRIESPKKAGIYIQNGKKVIIK